MNQSHLKSSILRPQRHAAASTGLFVVIFLIIGQAMAQSSTYGIPQNTPWSFSQSVMGEVDTECQCRAPDGQMKNLGTIECFDIVGNKKLVRCEMSTNTPFWKAVEGTQGCPAA